MDKLKYSDFFDFSNDKPIKEIISNLDEMEKSHNNLSKSIIRNSKNVVKSQKTLTKQAESEIKVVSKLNETLDKNQKKLGEMADSTNKMVETNSKYKKTLSDNKNQLTTLNKSINAINTTKKNLISTNSKEKAGFVDLKKQLKETQQEYKKSGGDIEAYSKKTAKLKVQIQEQNKVLKERARDSLGLTTAYQKESKRLNELRNSFKGLTLAGKENTAQGRKMRKEIDKLDSRLKKVDASVGQFQRNVGNYGSALSGIGNVLRSAGLIGGIAGIVSVVKNSIKIIAGFEKAISNLSSITGATGKDLSFYRKEAIKFGASTTKSSTEVVEAFKLVGSARPELLKSKEALASVTREALTLAEAAEIDVPTAAKALASGLNQFKLPATDAGRIINVLAAGSKEGAAAIPEITEAIDKFGSIAKTANISIESSVAAVEALAPAGLQGAEAGTKLRNVLIELQSGADEFNPAIVGLDQALENLGNQNLSVTELTEKFGKQNVLAAKTLIDERESVSSLTIALTGTSVAYDQASTNVDNLIGDVSSMSSAWEGLILSIENGDGVLNRFFRGTIQGVTKLLNLFSGLGETFEDVTKEIGNSARANRDLANSSEKLLDEYEALQNSGLKPTAKETERLDTITLALRDSLGESVTAINKETGALELNTDAVRDQIRLKRISFDKDAMQLASRLKGVQNRIKKEEDAEKTLQRIVDTRRKTIEDNGALSISINEKNNASLSTTVQLSTKLDDVQQKSMDAHNKSSNELRTHKEKLNESTQQAINILKELEALDYDLIDVENLFAETSKETTDIIIEGNEDSVVSAEAAAKRIKKSNRDLATFRLTHQIKLLEEVKNNEEKSVNERIGASELITDKKIELAEIAKEGELESTRGLIEEEKILINERFESLVSEAEKMGDDFSDSIFESLKIDPEAFDLLGDFDKATGVELIKFDTSQLNEISALNEAFLNGEIDSIEDYLARKEELESNSYIERLYKEKKFLETKLKLVEKSGGDVTGIQREIALIEVYITTKKVNKKTELEEEAAEKTKEIALQAYEASKELINVIFEEKISQDELEIAQIDERLNRELELAGNNDERKAQLEETAQKKKDELQKKVNKEKREQAKINKAIALVEIAINTAKGIATALGSFPPPASFVLAAATGVLGAIQLGIVASKKIPAFAKGTDNAPEGLAIINEDGPEMITERSGKRKMVLTDRPTLTYLKGGEKINTAKQTQDELARIEQNGLFNANTDTFEEGVNRIKVINEDIASREINRVLNQRFDGLERTIKNKTEHHWEITDGRLKHWVKDGENWNRIVEDSYA